MVLVDAIARRLPGAIREESGAVESFSAELDGGLEYPHYTRPPEFRGWRVPDVLLSGDHGKIDEWRREQSRRRTGHVSSPYEVLGVSTSASPQEIDAAYRSARARAPVPGRVVGRAARRVRPAAPTPNSARATTSGSTVRERSRRGASHNPIDRLFAEPAARLARGDRLGRHDRRRGRNRARDQGLGRQSVQDPVVVDGADPALRGAGTGCEARTSDRVLACRFCYHLRSPKRGDIVVFNTPSLAKQECGSEGTFVKRLIGLPGEVWEERDGFVYINGKKLDEGYIQKGRRDDRTMGLSDVPPRNTYTRIPSDYYLMMGDNRKSSCDSRVWGLVPRQNLIGNVFATYWPPGRVLVSLAKLRFANEGVRRFAVNARRLGPRASFGGRRLFPSVRLGHASRGRVASGRLRVRRAARCLTPRLGCLRRPSAVSDSSGGLGLRCKFPNSCLA